MLFYFDKLKFVLQFDKNITLDGFSIQKIWEKRMQSISLLIVFAKFLFVWVRSAMLSRTHRPHSGWLCVSVLSLLYWACIFQHSGALGWFNGCAGWNVCCLFMLEDHFLCAPLTFSLPDRASNPQHVWQHRTDAGDEMRASFRAS